MSIEVNVTSPTIQIRTAAATTAWSAQQIRDLGGMLGRGLVAKSAEYLVVEADRGKTIVCSGTFDVDLPSAATVGIGWMVAIFVASGTITVDGNGTETIRTPAGSAETAVVTQGQAIVLQSDGTNWVTCASSGLPSAPTATVTAAAFIGGSFDGTSASGIVTRQASNQDAVRLLGRAGGTSSYVATLTPTTLTASRAATLPDADITVAGINLAQTWTAAQNFGTGTTVIATADINGGAIDGTAIGAASASTGAFTTASFSGVITQSGVNTISGSTASRLVYFGGTVSDGGAIELRGSTYASGPDTGQFRVGSTYIGSWSSTAFTINSGINLTVASDTDATTLLGRARIASPVTDEASFGHFDQSANPAITQLAIGRTVVNATSGQELRFATGGTTRATITSAAFTLASGINLAMSGASTATFGTGLTHALGEFRVGDSTSSTTIDFRGGVADRQLVYRTGSSRRWIMRVDSGAESGSNAGSGFAIVAYDDANTLIDSPISIARAAGSAVIISRPLRISNTAATISSGTGTPEAAVTAPVGSLFLRTDGGASTTLYVKESGAGNTGWVAK